MKKIIIFFLALITYAHAQDSAKAVFPKDRKGLGRKINAAQLNGRPIDSTRIYKIGTDTAIRVTNKIYAEYGGIYGNGSDMTSKINLLLNRSYVNEVDFSYDTTTVITISGTVTVPAGKTITISPSTTFIGTGTINFNGNILNADPTKAIFASSLTIRGIATKDKYTRAEWFGAIGDGSTDNTTALNNAQLAGVVGQKVLVSKATSFYQINSAFTQGVDFVSLDSAEIRYNPSASATAVTMWTISTKGAMLKGIKLNGSKTVRRLIYVTPNIANVKIIDNDLSNVNQVGSETSTVELIYFTQGNDSLYIARNYIHHADAKNDGICRGIRGDYAGAAPVNVIIEDNTFDEIHDTFAGSDDSDDICLQSYTTRGNWVIRRNKHKSIWKRGIKAMVEGIKIYDEEFNSTRYSTASQRAYSAISIYANNVEVYNCRVNGGIFDNTIEIGANGQSYKNIWVSNVKCYTAYDATLINGGGSGADGFRWFGTLENVHVDDVFTQYNRYGYYIDCTGRDVTVNKATSNYSDANSFSNISASVKWIDGLSITNCKAKKSGNSIAFDFWRVRNFTFTGNETDSCGNGTPNTVTIRVDSLLGYTICHSNKAIGTWTTQPNYGTWANRPAFSNSSAGKNWQYTASDRGDTLFIHLGGGNWIATGSSTYGDYTPTFANYTNTSSVTNSRSGYTRSGNKVHVWIYATFTPTAGSTLTGFTATLPFASDLTSASDLTGHISGEDGTSFFGGGTVKGSTGLDIAAINFMCASNVGSIVMVTFDYTIQ